MYSDQDDASDYLLDDISRIPLIESRGKLKDELHEKTMNL